MAYIDANKLEKFIEDGLNNKDKSEAFGHDAIEILAEIFVMEVEEDIEKVVRCKDCKYYDKMGEYCWNEQWITPDDTQVKEDDFCSYGERRAKNDS